MKKILLILSILFVSTNVYADTNTTEGKLSNLGFGFALGPSFYGDTYIESASIHGENRIVTIDEEKSHNTSAWLTIVWNFYPQESESNDPKTSESIFLTKEVKYGLFVGANVVDGNGDSFNAFAIGPQATFYTEGNTKISLGVGVSFQKVKRLQDGIVAGEPLPDYFSQIQYKEESDTGLVILLSVSI